MNRHRRFLCTLLILVPFFAAGAAACSSTNVTSGPSSAKCQVTVGTLGAIVASGATANVPVTAPPECGWDATTQANWITALAPASGQGSAMLELLAEHPGLDTVSTPVGGGGLIGGSALAAKAMQPGIRVVGAEPEQADDAFRSFRSGQRHSVNAPTTIADGLRGSIGARNFELLRSHVDDVVTVSEEQIVAAMRIVLGDLKLLIEPSSAVPVAAALAGKLGSDARRVGLVLSGGNVDLDLCPFLRGKP